MSRRDLTAICNDTNLALRLAEVSWRRIIVVEAQYQSEKNEFHCEV